MHYLVTQILICLLIAALIGAFVGWFLRHWSARREIAEQDGFWREKLESTHADHQSIVGALTSDLTRETEAHAEAESKIKELDAALGAKEIVVGGLEEEAASLRARRTELDRLVADRDTELQSLTDKLERLDERSGTLSRELEGRNGRIVELEAQLKEQTQHGEEADRKLERADESLLRIRNELEQAKAQTERLERTVTERESELTARGIELEQANQRVEQLTDDCEQQGKKAAALERTVRDQRQQVADLEQALEVARAPAEDQVVRIGNVTIFPARPEVVDDLKEISGIGPTLERTLNELGIYQFRQIATWHAEEIGWVSDNLDVFKGRIERDQWVAQARQLQQQKYGQ